MRRFTLFRSLLCGLLLAGLALPANADEPSTFTSTLSAEDMAATGLTRLSDEQLASLNAQVQREIAIARQGGTPTFSTSFTRRNSPQQRKDAGLDQLMTLELRRLDELTATAVAAAAQPTTTGPVSTRLATKAPVSFSDWIETTPRRMEVHGEFTLAYTWGRGGRNGYGAEFAATLTDPSGKFSATVIVSHFHLDQGKGPCLPDEYESGRGW